MSNGQIPHLVSSDLEIQREQRRAQQEYQSLIENTPGMVYRASPDWTTKIVHGSESLCGYSARELGAMAHNWLTIIHPDDRKRVAEEARRIDREPAKVLVRELVQTSRSDLTPVRSSSPTAAA